MADPLTLFARALHQELSRHYQDVRLNQPGREPPWADDVQELRHSNHTNCRTQHIIGVVHTGYSLREGYAILGAVITLTEHYLVIQAHGAQPSQREHTRLSYEQPDMVPQLLQAVTRGLDQLQLFGMP